jgi:hypothetical protein
MFLIYVTSPRGPTPQKVETVPTNSQGRRLATLAQHELKPDEHELTLKILEQRYPSPEVNND